MSQSNPQPGAAVPIETVRPKPEPPAQAPLDDLLVADLLVEEVSIDGMCGVY